jgi:hypothetical protein
MQRIVALGRDMTVSTSSSARVGICRGALESEDGPKLPDEVVGKLI